jgi:hypothetical protein
MGFKGLDERIILTKPRRDGWEVMYPVSYACNGGPTYVVDPPVEPPRGWKFVDIAVGLERNMRPPHATMLMVKEKK